MRPAEDTYRRQVQVGIIMRPIDSLTMAGAFEVKRLRGGVCCAGCGTVLTTSTFEAIIFCDDCEDADETVIDSFTTQQAVAELRARAVRS